MAEGSGKDCLFSVRDALAEAGEWIILSHVKPDGDTLGTGSALWSLGTTLGKGVFWGGPDSFPERYAFLAGSGDYIPAPSFSALPLPGENTVLIVLDTSTSARSVPGLIESAAGLPLVNIDHHEDNERFGTLNWIDPGASSAGEMVWDLLRTWDVPIPLASAEALYTAIVTDCGSFAFSSTTEKTHEAAGCLIRLGVSPERMEGLIRHTRTLQSLHLWARSLSGAFLCSGFAAMAEVSITDFLETGAVPADTEFLVNELLTIQAVTFAALLVEEEAGVRVSLRSKGNISAAEIARSLGGGGHPQAAGYKSQLPLARAREGLLALLEKKHAERTAASE